LPEGALFEEAQDDGFAILGAEFGDDFVEHRLQVREIQLVGGVGSSHGFGFNLPAFAPLFAPDHRSGRGF
jgi:hypothetical protein